MRTVANPFPMMDVMEFVIRRSIDDVFIVAHNQLDQALIEAADYTLNTGFESVVYRNDALAIKSFQGWKTPHTIARSKRWNDLRFENVH